MPAQSPNQNGSAHALVEKFGTHSTSFQVLAPSFLWWQFDDDAALAYVDTGAAWVAAGPPLCAPHRLGDVAQAFIAEARQKSRRVVFFASPPELLPGEMGRSMVVGQEPLYVPQSWPTHKKSSANMRQQLRRAKNKHLSVRRLTQQDIAAPDGLLRQHIETLMTRWSGAHAMPPMGFLVDLNPFERAQERMFWVAELPALQNDAKRIVGFAAVAPIMAVGGYMLEHLLRDPDAPNGCAESLVDAVFTDLAQAPVISLGMVPLHHVSHPLLHAAMWAGEGLYHFGGLARFKAKLAPVRWEDVSIVWPRRQSSVVALYDVLCAFAPQGAWRFGAGIIARGSSVLLRGLAWVLVPWTVMLASMEGEVWFPSKNLQHFWTAFDVLLAVGLFRLSYKWRRSLATALAVLISCDAVASFVEVCLYREPKGLFAEAVRALAVLAPTASAVVLWNARAYRARHRLKDQPMHPGKT
jgi:phosphatidylglycerol lysyltransferase